MKCVRLFQQEIDKIATQKYDYDKLISHYTNIINEIDNITQYLNKNNNEKKDKEN